MYQCILNVPLWNDWSKVTYSQVHGSPVLKTLLLQSFWWISATRFAKLIQFWQDPKCRRNRTFWRKNWRKISYFVFIYIFPLVLLLIIYVCIYIYIYIFVYIYKLLESGDGTKISDEKWRSVWDLAPSW